MMFKELCFFVGKTIESIEIPEDVSGLAQKPYDLGDPFAFILRFTDGSVLGVQSNNVQPPGYFDMDGSLLD